MEESLICCTKLRRTSLDKSITRETMSVSRAKSALATSISQERRSLNQVSYSDFLLALQGLPHHRSSRSWNLKKSYESDQSEWDSVLIHDAEHVPHVDTHRGLLNHPDTESRSLPIYGIHPCTAFCPSCRLHVHTQLEFTEEVTLPKEFLRFLGLLVCCSSSNWLNKLRVHKCPFCESTLAKSCN